MSLLTYLQYVPLNVPAMQNDRRCCPLAVVPNSVNEFQEIRSLVWNICNGTRRLKYELDGQNPGKPRKGEGGRGGVTAVCQVWESGTRPLFFIQNPGSAPEWLYCEHSSSPLVKIVKRASARQEEIDFFATLLGQSHKRQRVANEKLVMIESEQVSIKINWES